MTSCFLSLLSVDPSLGKVDKHSLSQKTLLELLISGFTQNKEKICGDVSEPKDTSKWKGVHYNDSNEITAIRWMSLELEGSIDLTLLPETAKFVDFETNHLSGTADLTCLPDKIEFLYLSKNQFSGPIDLTQLPGSLESLFLYDNDFCGLTDFSKLPKSLKKLNIATTQLEGEVLAFEGILRCYMSNVKDMRDG